MSRIATFAVQSRKFLAALGSAVTVAISLGLLPDDVAKQIAGAVAVLGAFVVYYVPNETAEDDPADGPQHLAEG